MKHTTSRRAILAGIAASPALATPALAAIGLQSSPIDDPIFAIIDRYTAALAVHQDQFEGPGYEAAAVAMIAATSELRHAVAQTPQGLLAKLALVREDADLREHLEGLVENAPVEFLRSVERSVNGLIDADLLAARSQPTAREVDPIFAAIERHKVAFSASQVMGNIQCNTVDAKWSPEYDPVECEAVEEAASAADAADAAAANALTTIRPTTIAGLLALMHHVEQFNAGAFVLEINPDGWYSKPMHWPANLDEDEIDLFGYSVLANVRRALEAMAVQS